MCIGVIFDSQRDLIIRIIVTIQVKSDVRLIDREVSAVDIIHVLRGQIPGHLLLEISIEAVRRIKEVFKCHCHVGFRQRCDGAVRHAAPHTVRKLSLLTVDHHAGYIIAVRILIDTDCTGSDLIVIEIRVVRSCREHSCVSASA